MILSSVENLFCQDAVDLQGVRARVTLITPYGPASGKEVSECIGEKRVMNCFATILTE